MRGDDFSIAARFIAVWDILEVESGPDRVVIKGTTGVTNRSSQSASIGVTYEQIDQLIVDLLTARMVRQGTT